MKPNLLDTETTLELGIVAFAVALVIGVALAALGRRSGNVAWRHAHNEPPPIAGDISSERHRHVRDVASR